MSLLNMEDGRTDVFSAPLARYLEANGFISPVIENTRNILRKFMPHSSPTSSQASAPSAGSIAQRFFRVPCHLNSVPVHLHSAETYRFLGFEPFLALRIWEKYESCNKHSHNDFLEVAFKYINTIGEPDAIEPEDGWYLHMHSLGITYELADDIMHKTFENSQKGTFCNNWLIAFMSIRFSALLSLEMYGRAAMERMEKEPWTQPDAERAESNIDNICNGAADCRMREQRIQLTILIISRHFKNRGTEKGGIRFNEVFQADEQLWNNVLGSYKIGDKIEGMETEPCLDHGCILSTATGSELVLVESR